jgi:hypothetical protein
MERTQRKIRLLDFGGASQAENKNEKENGGGALRDRRKT